MTRMIDNFKKVIAGGGGGGGAAGAGVAGERVRMNAQQQEVLTAILAGCRRRREWAHPACWTAPWSLDSFCD